MMFEKLEVMALVEVVENVIALGKIRAS